MTTYAPNFSPRYKAHYTVGGIDHTIQIRGSRGDDITLMLARGALLHDAFNAFAAQLYDDFAWISAELALTDSDVFIPATTPAAVTGTIDPTTVSPVQRIKALTFSGKAAGSRARFSLYGITFDDISDGSVGGDGTVLTAESAAVGTVATLASGNWRAASGGTAVFPGRATYKENDHLLKLVRKGTIT